LISQGQEVGGRNWFNSC